MRIDAPQMTPLQARASAIVLALLALLLGYFVLLHWWFVAPLLHVDGEIQQLEQQHAKYAAAIAEQPALERAVKQLDHGGANAGAFLSATDTSTAAADLIQRATDVVAAHAHEGSGCSMPSKMPVDDDDAKDPFRKVSVSITLDCGMQPLAGVLHAFDRGRPYLFVDSLSLARAPGGRLQAQLTLSGYLRPAGAP